MSFASTERPSKIKLLKMAKELSKVVKLQVRGGAANPSPPVGPL